MSKSTVASVSIASGDGGVVRMAAEDVSFFLFFFSLRAVSGTVIRHVYRAASVRYTHALSKRAHLSPPYNPQARYV
jgi:hypothetical protein